MAQQRLARGSGAHTALTARKQRDVDEHLEIGEPLADRRRRDELAFRGARDRAFLANGNEQAQRHLIDLPHAGRLPD